MKKNTLHIKAKVLDIVYQNNNADIILYQAPEMDELGRIIEKGEALRATMYTKEEVKAFRQYCEDHNYNKQSFIHFKLELKFNCILHAKGKYTTNNTLKIIDYE